MSSIWEAPAEIQKLIRDSKAEHHPHLTLASFWVLVTDSKGVRNNRVIATQSKKCTKTEKLSTNHDFKIIVFAETWSTLTDQQREIAIDEALCRCGVKRVPQTIEVNGKKEAVKDDLGRTIFTDEIDYDKEGNPRWCIEQPDAELFFGLIIRHRRYSEEMENTRRAYDGKPLKLPIAIEAANLVEADIL